MATQTVVQTDNGIQGIVLTSALGNADTSTVFATPPAQQAFFLLQGAIGSPAATVVVEASYDGGTTFQTLKDDTATAMSFTAITTSPIKFTPPGGAAIRVRSAGGTATALNWFIGYSKAFI